MAQVPIEINGNLLLHLKFGMVKVFKIYIMLQYLLPDQLLPQIKDTPQ